MFNELVHWPEGKHPYACQIQAEDFALDRLTDKDSKRLRSCYLAMEPGLGKTIVAALIINYFNLEQHHTAYYICPPFLLSNTEAELLKWGVSRKQFVLIPDTKINEAEIKPGRKILIVDEAHRFKNDKANRSIHFFDVASKFDMILFMSGTPLPNSRPAELWPLLVRYAPWLFGKAFWEFAKRFCGAKRTHFGWRADSFTNKGEFWQRIAPWMLVMEKSKVMPDLPPKREGMLTVGDKMSPTLSKLEGKVLAHFTRQDLLRREISELEGKGQLHLLEYLKHLGEAKLKYAFPYIESLLYDTDENILIFAHHKSVIEKLSLWLTNFNPLVITGETPMPKRQKIVDEYQTNPDRRVFIGNILAAGIGFTLTKATRVLFIEFSWRDGDNQQAADRAHRIGQKNAVLVQYVVLKDSFDRRRMEIILEKREK